MIDFNSFQLNNGLKVIVHEDPNTPLAAVNLIYKVGSRNENPNKTGFAHLFEHLMFGGSVNIPSFDGPLQLAGGESNAFTNPDITNYYNILPANNLETAFWLESDRMLSLDFSQRALDVQRKVVVEEFNETCLNQPYGDSWHKVLAMAFKVHSYNWPTIGKEVSHIRDATLEDVKDFFFKYYRPNNAILCVAGGVKTNEVEALAKKWFDEIEAGEKIEQQIPEEPPQTEARKMETKADVPINVIYKVFHICNRFDPKFHATDMLTDILSDGKSSRLYENLIKKQKLFSDINAHVTGSLDKGLFVIEGKLNPGVSMEKAEEGIDQELEKVKCEKVEEKELEKVKNKIESYLVFSEVNLLNRAMSLAYFEMAGDPGMVNLETEKYHDVSRENLLEAAQTNLQQENSSALYYFSNN